MRTDSELDLKTRRSLLSRLRNLDDHESWRDFFELYWRMLYRVARRAGLGEADAEDVVQETVVAVARQMPRFRYDAARGSFKGWLFRIVGRRVTDHLRRVYREPPRAETVFDTPADEGTAEPSDPVEAGDAMGLAWEQEWEQAVFEAAVARVREQTNPKHFQVFDCCVRLGWPAAKVAATLGLSAAQVYLARHRVSRAVKQAARIINDERLLDGFPPGQPAAPAG
jgi:RNA polymerase sigma-70 factor (ECF subfamily)